MERYSTCCGAEMKEIVKKILICPDCKEHCSLDTLCKDCEAEEIPEKKFEEWNGICERCSRLL